MGIVPTAAAKWEVMLTYLELCMVYRFFRCLVYRLMVAVVMWVSGISKKQPKLWRHTVYMQKDDIFYDGWWILTSGPAVKPAPRDPSELPLLGSCC